MFNDRQNEESGGEVRVWCDGCYDLVHFGHANSLRQAKALGDRLAVGIHTDEDITTHKGPPVFTLAERSRMIRGLKWVDEVVEGSPYVTTLETLDKYGCDFCCHGDDITFTEDGLDTYHQIKNAGRYREVQRTAGISTTGLVKRILDRTQGRRTNCLAQPKSPWTGSSTFHSTTEKIRNFTGDNPPRLRDAKKVVYVAGAFDLFHVGHMDFLEKVRALGDYVIVGLHSDAVVEGYNGPNYPIMTLQERLQSVLACKYVSETVIGAPYIVTEDLMEHFGVDLVADGNFPQIDDPFKCPKQLQKFTVIDSGSDVTTEKIVARIASNRTKYEKRNKKKEEKELEIISKLAQHV